MPLSQVDIEKVKHLHDVDSASSYLFSQIKNTTILQKALDYSIVAHKNQFRKSGEPYIIHPILVASIVSSITNDESTVTVISPVYSCSPPPEYTLKKL